LKITYQTWWQVFFHQYRIKNYKDVEQSGIYYNETSQFYEAHFKAADKPTKVVARVSEAMLNDCEPSEASKLVKELTGQLSEYFRRTKVPLDVPQFGELSEVM
jgi:hypothetical protein